MATHSSILAWQIPWPRSLAGYSPWGCKWSDATEQLNNDKGGAEGTFHLHQWVRSMVTTWICV